MNSSQATQITQFKNDTYRLVSRLLERDFVNCSNTYGKLGGQKKIQSIQI